MEWLFIMAIFFIAIVVIAGRIFYKKNKELNKKIAKLTKEQNNCVYDKWLS